MRRLRSALKPLVSAVWNSRPYGWFLLAHDRLIARTVRRSGVDRTETLVVTPSGRGNIGDQAMFDSIVAAIDGPIHAIFHSRGALQLSDADKSRVRITVLPRAVRGQIVVRTADVRRYARALDTAQRVLIPGADTIDGGHPHASLTRLNLAHLASERGIPTVVQGFSWSGSAPASVTASIRRLAPRARVHPRDPVGARRLAASGVAPIDSAADVVFTYDRTSALPPALERYLRDREGAPIAIVNISGFIARRMNLLEDFREVVTHLRRNGFSVVFLPHVIRAGDDDLEQARRLHELVGEDGDFLVDAVLSPAQVKRLASRAFLTVTGRMHLAIMSLTHSTPAITLATVGKVEGLYEMFDLPELVVQPRPGCSADLIRSVQKVLADHDGVSASIGDALPRVRALAARNFQTA